jgi:hypothetical protein
VTQRPSPAGPDPSPAEWEALWRDLARVDATTAYRALGRLMAAPDGAALLLAKHLHRVRPAEGDQVMKLVEQLDDPRFALRTKSAQHLAGLG